MFPYVIEGSRLISKTIHLFSSKHKLGVYFIGTNYNNYIIDTFTSFVISIYQKSIFSNILLSH